MHRKPHDSHQRWFYNHSGKFSKAVAFSFLILLANTLLYFKIDAIYQVGAFSSTTTRRLNELGEPILNALRTTTVWPLQRFGLWPCEVAWLMTFPNSGTGFVTQAITRVSGRLATATNYAGEVKSENYGDPLFAYSEKGPFRSTPHRLPESFILTKTHCKHCIKCLPRDNLTIPFDEFLQGCSRVGIFDSNGESMISYYDPKIAKRLVHLIRNPFDNIIANFHYFWKKKMKSSGREWRFSYDREGFRKWCSWMDDRFLEEGLPSFYSDEVSKIAQQIPCHFELFQYVQWHNNAFRVPIVLDAPSLIIYYEDFHYEINRNIIKILHFLQLPRISDPAPFIFAPKSDFFTGPEIDAAASFVNLVGSVDTINALRRYFPRAHFP